MRRNKLKSFCMVLVIAILFTLSTIFVIGAVTEDTTENSYVKIVPYEDVTNYRTNPDEIEGYVFAGWFSDGETCDITTALSSDYTSGPAYAKYVPEGILGVRVQTTSKLWNSDTMDDSTGALRFVTSVDTLNYKEVGFIINIGGADNYKASRYVYQQLYEEVGDGSTTKTNKYVPSQLFHTSSTYFKTWTVTDINELKYLLKFNVTPYWITLDGTTVKGDMETVNVNQVRSWDYVFVDDTGESDENHPAIGTKNYPYKTLDTALRDMKSYRAQAAELYASATSKDSEGKDGIVCIRDSFTATSGYSWTDHDMDVIITSDVADISKLDISDISTVVDESTLDFSEVQTVKVGDGVTFANLTLALQKNGAVYASGNRMKIASSVASENPDTTVYGGGSAEDVSGTDITILAGSYKAIYGGGRKGDVTGDTHVKLENTNVYNTETGGEARVHGGCNKGTVTGDTHVTIGKGFNSGTGFDYSSHSKHATVWGGGFSDDDTITSIVEGNTYVTVTDDAKANYVSGGGYLRSKVMKTSHVIFEGGYLTSIYGGSAGSSSDANAGKNGVNSNTSVVMTGGQVSQVFGGNEYGSLEGNTSVQILGGEVTRRIFGGCYNNYARVSDSIADILNYEWKSHHSVTGYSSVTIGADATVELSDDSDWSLCAVSRLQANSASEKGVLVLNPGKENTECEFRMAAGDTADLATNFRVTVGTGGTAYGEHNGLRIKPNNGKVAIVRIGNPETGDIVFYTESEAVCALSKLGAASTSSVIDTYVVFEDAKPEGVNTDGCEAKVNGAYYDTLKEAVVAANALSTITESTDSVVVSLLKDVTIDETLTIDDSANIKVQSYVDSTTNATTNTTYTITYSNADNNLFEAEGTLAIENLNLEGGKSGIYAKEGSAVTATDVNVKRLSATGAAVVVIDKKAEFTLGVTIDEKGNEVGTSSIDGNNLVGRGVEVQGTFNLNGGTIKKNTVEGDGAGVNVPIGGSFTMSGGNIQENTASACGGGVAVRGDFIMTGGTIQSNEANKGAGVIARAEAKITMTDGTIQDNTAEVDGGGIYIQSRNVPEINGVIIKENRASQGGGVYVNLNTPTNNKFIMSAGTIHNNTATAYGGGVYVHNGTFEMTGGTISGSEPEGESDSSSCIGGGVYVRAAQTFNMNGENAVIENNYTTAAGAGVYVAGTFTMSKGTIQGNNTTSDGAGVYVVEDATFEMTGGTIQNNTASSSERPHGGGVYVAGTFTMSNQSLIQMNTATSTAKNSYGFGAGVYVTGEFVMNNGTISNHGSEENKIASKGAGVCVNDGGTFTMYNGNIEYNYASQAGAGVAVEATTTGNASFTMYDGTIANNNSSGAAGAIVVRANTSFTMEDGIIQSNTASTTGGAVHVLGTATMKEGSITSNNAARGGGVYTNTNGLFTMQGGSITANTATEYGSGVYVNSAEAYPFTMSGGTISNHGSDTERQASIGAGVYVAAGAHFKLTGSGTVKANYTSESGAGLAVAGKFSYSGGNIQNNIATKDGGGVYVLEGGNFIMNTTRSIISNQAENGGGVYVNNGTFSMKQGTISSNTATASGAGVYVNDGTFTMTNDTTTAKTIMGNIATTSGAGVYVNAGTFNMEHGTISNHGTSENKSASVGTGVYVANDATFNMSGDNTYVKENYTTAMGAGVAVVGTFNMNGGYITDNSSVNSTAKEGEGAGVCVKGTGVVTMTAGSISNNAVSGSGAGVSIREEGTFTMEEGTISSNIAEGSGGGIIVRSTKTATTDEGVKKVATFVMNGGTISSNQAKVSGGNGGGAIFQDGDTSVLISAGTISGNEATNNVGGAIYMSSRAELTIENGDITGNYSKGNAGAIYGAGNNKLYFTGTGSIIGNTNTSVPKKTVESILLNGSGTITQVTLSTTFTIGDETRGDEIRFNGLQTRDSQNPILIIDGDSLGYNLRVGFHAGENKGVAAYIKCKDATTAEQMAQKIIDFESQDGWTYDGYDPVTGCIKAHN